MGLRGEPSLQLSLRLVGAWPLICGSEARLFHAASLIALFDALQIGELVPASHSDCSGQAFALEDDNMPESALAITSRQSKIDQLHRSPPG